MSEQTLNCIRCRAPLKSVVDGEAKVKSESCICCRGLWFTKADFLSAVAIDGVGKTSDADKLQFNCPKCLSVPLYNFRIDADSAPVISCAKCLGVWIDGGQFLKLKGLLQTAAKRKKDISARENFNLAMNLPKNIPRKSGFNWLGLVAVVLVIIGVAGLAFFAYKKYG